VPPSGPFSTTATDYPRFAATLATSSPEPEPITRKSNSSIPKVQPHGPSITSYVEVTVLLQGRLTLIET
jgi:hypothetical protein